MSIQITQAEKTQHGSYFQATANKVSALVCVYKYGVQVCCQNSSHKVWSGAGRLFTTVEQAIAGYKSSEMKAIIQSAVEFASNEVV